MYRIITISVVLLFLTSCSSIKKIETFFTPVEREPLLLEDPMLEKLEPMKWIIITSENADALGIELNEQTSSKPKGDLEQQIWDQLKTCYDPEIPVNIVELGLIYDLQINDLRDEKEVTIKMTLTAPGCGMGPVIADEVDRKINGLEGVGKVSVDLVWEPMWNRDMMSEEAQLELGMM